MHTTRSCEVMLDSICASFLASVHSCAQKPWLELCWFEWPLEGILDEHVLWLSRQQDIDMFVPPSRSSWCGRRSGSQESQNGVEHSPLEYAKTRTCTCVIHLGQMSGLLTVTPVRLEHLKQGPPSITPLALTFTPAARR